MISFELRLLALLSPRATFAVRFRDAQADMRYQKLTVLRRRGYHIASAQYFLAHTKAAHTRMIVDFVAIRATSLSPRFTHFCYIFFEIQIFRRCAIGQNAIRSRCADAIGIYRQNKTGHGAAMQIVYYVRAMRASSSPFMLCFAFCTQRAASDVTAARVVAAHFYHAACPLILTPLRSRTLSLICF